MNYESMGATAVLKYTRLLDPSGDKPIHSAVDVPACTAHVPAALQAFLHWLQVSEISPFID